MKKWEEWTSHPAELISKGISDELATWLLRDLLLNFLQGIRLS